MKTSIFLTGIIGFLLILMVIGIIFWLLGEYGKRQLANEQKYDDRTISRMYALFNFMTLKCDDFRKK